MSQQLTLDVLLQQQPRFENYVVGENAQLLHSLQTLAANSSAKIIYLYGQLGCGRTHLLQACCDAALKQGLRAFYLDLAECMMHVPDVLHGAEQLNLLCLDNLGAIAGKRQWEEAIFDCYHRLFDHGGKFVVAADRVPQDLSLVLPDLQSRLRSGEIYHVKPLSDEQKLAALKLHAVQRGLVLSDQVGAYLLAHFPRDMRCQLSILDQLDRASLAEQRQLTVQFIKNVLV